MARLTCIYSRSLTCKLIRPSPGQNPGSREFIMALEYIRARRVRGIVLRRRIAGTLDWSHWLTVLAAMCRDDLAILVSLRSRIHVVLESA